MQKLAKIAAIVATFFSIQTGLMAECRSWVPCSACCPPSFDGFYFGGNVGVINYDIERRDRDGYLSIVTGTLTPQTLAFNRTRFIGGLQVGYDFLMCKYLLGLVVDWNWTNIKHRKSFFSELTNVTDVALSTRLHWISTIRCRAGFVFCDILFYLTGGAAIAELKTNFHNFITAPIINESLRFRRHLWGWTLGVGSEFSVWRNWTLNGEVLYVRFEKEKQLFFSPAFATLFNVTRAGIGYEDKGWMGRVGLNYRFSTCRW